MEEKGNHFAEASNQWQNQLLIINDQWLFSSLARQKCVVKINRRVIN